MKPRILLVHPEFSSPGGGNAVGAWALQALRDVYDVTLLAWEPVDWDRVNAAFGTSLRPGDVRVRVFPTRAGRSIDRFPVSLSLLRFGLLQRYARSLQRRERFELVASTANEIDAGVRALQYVHFPWGYFPRPDTDLRWYHLPPLVHLYRRFVFVSCGISRARIACNETLANSGWTAGHFRAWYGTQPGILSPPVHTLDEGPPWAERGDTFAVVGRMSPEKRILEVITMLAAVRERGYDVSLLVCAQRDDAAYERRVRDAVRANAAWVTLVCDLPRAELLERISRCRFGLHGMVGEHFGIAVAELLRLGCICFASAEGGPAEILGHDERLLYTSDGDAIEKICAMLADPVLRSELRDASCRYARRFSAETFMRDFRSACAALIAAGGIAPAAAPRRDARGLRTLAKRVLPAPVARGAGRIYRTAYAWLIRRTGNPAEEVETPAGRYRLPRDAPHDYIAAAIRNGAMFEPEVVALAAEFNRPGATIVDAGANFGQMAVAFSRLAGTGGHVVAIEANPDLFPLLEYNLRANGATNVRAVFGAVYRTSGATLRFPRPQFWREASYGSYGVDPRAKRGVRVPTVTLDDLDIPGPIGFVKIDTQGCDLDVLRGARGIIARDRMPIVFEYEAKYDAAFETSFADYEAFIAEIGYRITRRIAQNILIEPRSGETAAEVNERAG